MQGQVTAEAMAQIDKRAQEEYGIPQSTLMENAGKCVADIIISESNSFKDEKIAVFCGKGNNGGDGFVASRYFFEKSPKSLVVFAIDKDNVRGGSALDNYKKICSLGIKIRPIEDFFSKGLEDWGFTLVVDAVFGTGFKGELPEVYSSVGETLNSSSTEVYAVDIPSGLDTTTGKAAKNSPRAKKTITFGLSKKGFFIADGPSVSGEVEVCSIGFPEELLEQYK